MFDIPSDRYLVFANGRWLNRAKGGNVQKNPYKHKQAPISSFVPFPVVNTKHGISVPRLTDKLRTTYRNIQEKKLRLVDKLEGWDVVSPDIIGDWREKKRMQDEHGVLVANPQEVRHETPNIQNYTFLQAESNDVLAQLADLVGWTFQALQSYKYENKSATLARTGAVTRTVEHIIRNSLSGMYQRWITQRLSNLQYLYNTKKKPLSAYGLSYATVNGGELIGEDSAFYMALADIDIPLEGQQVKSIMELQIEDIQGAVEIHPDVDTILVNSKEQQLIMLKEAMGMFMQLPTES